jgi:hypothetical protein
MKRGEQNLIGHVPHLMLDLGRGRKKRRKKKKKQEKKKKKKQTLYFISAAALFVKVKHRISSGLMHDSTKN